VFPAKKNHLPYFNVQDFFSAYREHHRRNGDANLCASYTVFLDAFHSVEGTVSFRHGKGAFPTCEFCNVVEHMLQKSKNAQETYLDGEDVLSSDAITMLAEMMVLHRKQQSKCL
jgi:hypothetical protein